MKFVKAATNVATTKIFKNGNFKIQLPNEHENDYRLDIIDLSTSSLMQLKVKRPLNSNSILFKGLKDDEVEVKEFKRQKVRIYYEDSFVRLYSREFFDVLEDDDEVIEQEPTPLDSFDF